MERLISMNFEDVLERRWWVGGRRDFWIRNIDRIGQFIEKTPGVKPMSAKDMPLPPESQEIAGAKARLIPRPFPGGMRIPHLHFRGEVYRLNIDQWKGFSAQVLQDYRKRLDSVQSIGFEPLLDVADAVESAAP